MSRTIGDLKSSDPTPEEAALGEYYLAYSELESWLRQLVALAIATTHGYSGDRYSRSRQMVDALTRGMTFAAIENAIEEIVEIRTKALEEQERAKLQSQWKMLRKRCASERERRNRFAHSSVTIEEDLGGAILVSGRKPKTYSAEQLKERSTRIRGLTRDIQNLATRLLMTPFE